MNTPTMPAEEVFVPTVPAHTEEQVINNADLSAFVPVSQRRRLGSNPLWQEYLAEVKAIREADRDAGVLKG